MFFHTGNTGTQRAREDGGMDWVDSRHPCAVPGDPNLRLGQLWLTLVAGFLIFFVTGGAFFPDEINSGGLKAYRGEISMQAAKWEK